ncbi:hypothetical protein BKA56DRAFT_658380 [Ilyonectria sp. MPI-CAGE-AT-0026]|nr:hypothetical protein BKA56DRAFT_658380 [Ilyonectria sp. MPI-CAGE-AT-0026]
MNHRDQSRSPPSLFLSKGDGVGVERGRATYDCHSTEALSATVRYCVLCGVPITRRLHEPWLREFRAVWIEDDKWDNVKLSGVGTCDENDDVVTGTVPSDPHRRYDDPIDPNPLIEVELKTFNLAYLVHPETSRYEPEPFWGWACHSSCWNILNTEFTPNLRLLFEICLSMPIGVDSIMDWGHNYGEVVALQRNHEIPILGRRFSALASIPQDLRSDSFDIPSLATAIRHSVRLRNDAIESRLSRQPQAGDTFSRLSPELLQLIATLLLTSDVRSIGLISSAFAILSLPEKFWASRFKRGNEFDLFLVARPQMKSCEDEVSLRESSKNHFKYMKHEMNKHRVVSLVKLCQINRTNCETNRRITTLLC